MLGDTFFHRNISFEDFLPLFFVKLCCIIPLHFSTIDFNIFCCLENNLSEIKGIVLFTSKKLFFFFLSFYPRRNSLQVNFNKSISFSSIYYIILTRFLFHPIRTNRGFKHLSTLVPVVNVWGKFSGYLWVPALFDLETNFFPQILFASLHLINFLSFSEKIL